MKDVAVMRSVIYCSFCKQGMITFAVLVKSHYTAPDIHFSSFYLRLLRGQPKSKAREESNIELGFCLVFKEGMFTHISSPLFDVLSSL